MVSKLTERMVSDEFEWKWEEHRRSCSTASGLLRLWGRRSREVQCATT